MEAIAPRTFRAGFSTIVEKVYVGEGQQVKDGQLLFDLDDKSVQSDLAQVRADLATQQESLRAAKAGGRADQVVKMAGDLKKVINHEPAQLRHDNESLTKLVAQKAATPQELEQKSRGAGPGWNRRAISRKT